MSFPRDLPLYGFVNPSGRLPAFLLPVFGTPQSLWIQDGSGDGVVEGFVPCTAPVEEILQTEQANTSAKIGAPVLHAFQFSAEKPLVGTKPTLHEVLSKNLSRLQDHPFVRLEVVGFLNDLDALPDTIRAGFERMAELDPRTASDWAALMASPLKGPDCFIVDNGDKEWNVLRYVRQWAAFSNRFDVATGNLEIGALLALDGAWQKIAKIRILMGDGVTARTQKAFAAALKQQVKDRLDANLELEKEKNDFLHGAAAVARGMGSRQIECRLYAARKFHAKALIASPKLGVLGPVALTGSSNLTVPGLTENIELNVQTRDPAKVEALRAWFEQRWVEAEDVTPEIIRVIERQIREYTPFDVYAKALYEFFRGHEMTASEWELAGPTNGGSHLYPILDQYQKEGYHSLLKIARQFRGAFLCDDVGLGKTFIGMMLIERLIRDRKKVVLFVPKAARKAVWESALRKYLPHLGGDFTDLVIFNHTDLMRGGDFPERLARLDERADAVIIDEAHHFRNPGVKGTAAPDSPLVASQTSKQSRYWKLHEILESKTVFLLTATPINNRLIDLQHLIELFSRHQSDYFKSAPLGIHSLPGHFRKMEKELERIVCGNDGDVAETNELEAEQVLTNDALFRALVVQRSRAYVKASQSQHGGNHAIFPKREDPKVAEYSIKKTYGKLLTNIEAAFSKDKPLFSLALYYPLAYYKGSDSKIDPVVENRQKQVVALIRVQFLKRFESSVCAFERSCERLLVKLLAFVTRQSQTDAEKKRLQRWKDQNAELIGGVQEHQLELFGEPDDEPEEDLVTEEMLEDVEVLPRDKYKVEEILAETFLDLDQIANFLAELNKFKPSHDDKLKALIKLLKADSVLKDQKALIFTEFMDTARYLRKELAEAGIVGLDEVDSASKKDRGQTIEQFAPYYNGSSSAQLAAEKLTETRILISTDVLSEGLNLQDATRLINYDLHWNPVRLMQRIGRVDRRMNPSIEARLVADHPDQKELRGTVAYWNFLPPDELDDLLKLYGRVSHKTLRISKVFGIEGKKLLTPEDNYEALKEFTHSYEGTATGLEKMHLVFQALLDAHPDLANQLPSLPGRVFSGKEHLSPGTKAVFFCYALPAPEGESREHAAESGKLWTEEAGLARWYLYDLAQDRIAEQPEEIIEIIRCEPETPRVVELPQKQLSDLRKKVEKHITNTYFKSVQAPVGVKPILKCWMELN